MSVTYRKNTKKLTQKLARSPLTRPCNSRVNFHNKQQYFGNMWAHTIVCIKESISNIVVLHFIFKWQFLKYLFLMLVYRNFENIFPILNVLFPKDNFFLIFSYISISLIRCMNFLLAEVSCLHKNAEKNEWLHSFYNYIYLEVQNYCNFFLTSSLFTFYWSFLSSCLSIFSYFFLLHQPWSLLSLSLVITLNIP